MSNHQYRHLEPVLVAVAYNKNGEVVKWAEGQIERVFRAYGVEHYVVKRMDTLQLIYRVDPPDLKPWPKSQE